MFIKTIKVKKPNVLGIAVAVIIVAMIAVLIMITCRFSGNNIYEMKSETQRQSFLQEMGWKASDEYDECKIETIPEKFNDVYSNYNKLQKQQGFDLEKFKGKSVEIYTYKIKNYSDENKKSENVVCHLMVYEGQLIGGDVCSTELDGFMQGLKKA